MTSLTSNTTTLVEQIYMETPILDFRQVGPVHVRLRHYKIFSFRCKEPDSKITNKHKESKGFIIKPEILKLPTLVEFLRPEGHVLHRDYFESPI